MKISIFDPGLESATGHHMALLEHFIDHASTDTEIDYYCAKNFDTSVITPIVSVSSVSVFPVFNSGFYDRYNTDLSYTDANDYVLSLATEYLMLLNKVTSDGSHSRSCILLPTLLWEHALAFDQALQRFKKGTDNNAPDVVSLLMFNPICFESIGSGRLTLNFSMAFRALAKHPEVQFYAGDNETMNAYASILNKTPRLASMDQQPTSRYVGLHPCFLVNQHQNYQTQDQTYVVGYLGDAKREKGFLSLPEVIDEFTKGDSAQKLLIQYTLYSNCQELRAVDRQVKQKVDTLTDVELVRGYVPSETLGNYLANSTEIALNYDETAYLNKTSGLVWLAAYHSLKLRCSRNTWMWREYQRLSNSRENSPVDDAKSTATTSSSEPGYYQEIFSPFVPWLASRYIAHENRREIA